MCLQGYQTRQQLSRLLLRGVSASAWLTAAVCTGKRLSRGQAGRCKVSGGYLLVGV